MGEAFLARVVAQDHGRFLSLHMLKKRPLLILEKDPGHLATLQRQLADEPYALTATTSAEDALSAFTKIHHEVVLLGAAVAGEFTALQVCQQLFESEVAPIVLMLVGNQDAALIVEAHRIGVVDFIIAGTDGAELLRVVERAFARAQAELTGRAAELERRRHIEKQLASRRVAEQLLRRQNDKFARALFGNIHTSFTQGRGVGSLTTLIAMLAGSPTTSDGQHYLITKDILDLVFTNQNAVNGMIEMFSELQLLVSQDFVLHDVTAGELHEIVRNLIYDLKPQIDIRGHSVILNEMPARLAGCKLKINWEFMRKALKELVLNALKFSPDNSTVMILVEYLQSRALVTVCNQPDRNGAEGVIGIPEELRRFIFEPFSRVSRVVHEQYDTLEYGLGLTYVEKIVQMHHGSIRCTTLTDTERQQAQGGEMVAMEIELPI